MQMSELKDLTINPHAPDWLVEAMMADDILDSGAYCTVLESSDPSRVIKLSFAKADLDAHKALAEQSIHFPRSFRRFDDAFTNGEHALHAIELERVTPGAGKSLKRLSDFFYCNKESRSTRLHALFDAASGFKTGEDYAVGLPESLGLALEQLANYAADNHGYRSVIDLYHPGNWGTRADGTIVIIDPLNLPFPY